MAAVAAAAAARRGNSISSAKHYPPTPYDDLLNQITDREPASIFGQAALASHAGHQRGTPGALSCAAKARLAAPRRERSRRRPGHAKWPVGWCRKAWRCYAALAAAASRPEARHPAAAAGSSDRQSVVSAAMAPQSALEPEQKDTISCCETWRSRRPWIARPLERRAWR